MPLPPRGGLWSAAQVGNPGRHLRADGLSDGTDSAVAFTPEAACGMAVMTTSTMAIETSKPVQTCDVCIVGAGITGMNALFVASRYLTPEQKVILIDRRSRIGGMWVDTYDYVRLHQPHGFFTAGNIKWTLDQDPSHLATKGEVLDHFQHCLEVIKRRVQVDEMFGWEVESHTEINGIVRITCRSTDGRSQIVETKRLIKASGAAVIPNDPLDLSSQRVRSVSPDYCDMRGPEIAASDTPVWVIGGGKTAMDTAHAVITRYPGRELNLVAGSGTYFTKRDLAFPKGMRRWWDGQVLSTALAHTARSFDGTNEAAVTDWYRARYGTWVTPATGNFLFGVLSADETSTIAAGLNRLVMDHLVDAVDRGENTELIFRSGSTTPITPGSWIVNCTGYFNHAQQPYEPYVSDSGAVLSLNMSSMTMHLPSYAGYFMTHLLFLDALRDVPLYELDWPQLRRKSNAALPYALLALVEHNLSVITDNVPTKVLLECGLDFDRWFPLPRRLAATARFMLRHRRDREHNRRTLDTIRDRFGVRCGPLDHRSQACCQHLR